ncbi:hypothetical protein [Kribbella speibonae]|uniref:hypothetical protein n=1 Tax=Kribbella speibonae TaxID=1572660 RepID=UPI0013F43B56|nr:hypothetical protein [Kribbella speibonae]
MLKVLAAVGIAAAVLAAPVASTIGYRLIDTAIGCLIAILSTLVLRRRHVA